jgi:bifunctional UDP-N-acetylglucosamine pyrophosphorylase/glucosamine-1-phosphate N-acetyltransferase/UDP-N-acetylglucosamine pyrophosphorylase
MSWKKDIGVVVLAAGKGKRMGSNLTKVLHHVNGKSMIVHVVDCAVKVSGSNVIVVVGHQADQVKEVVAKRFKVDFAIQKRLLGTGDAVRAALPLLSGGISHVVVLCGDVPLIKACTVERLVEFHLNSKNRLTTLAVEVDDSTGYGRIILDDEKKLVAICEEADASTEEKKIKMINSGIYCIEREFLTSALEGLTRANAQNEYYLTDLVKIGAADGIKMGVVNCNDSSEVLGVNTPLQLNQAEKQYRQRSNL